MVPALAKLVQLLELEVRQDQGGTRAGGSAVGRLPGAELISKPSSFRLWSTLDQPSRSRAGIPEDNESGPRLQRLTKLIDVFIKLMIPSVLLIPTIRVQRP